MSRSAIDNLIKVVKPYGARGLAWFKVNEDGWGPIVSSFLRNQSCIYREWAWSPETSHSSSPTRSVANASLNALRLHFGGLWT